MKTKWATVNVNAFVIACHYSMLIILIKEKALVICLEEPREEG